MIVADIIPNLKKMKKHIVLIGGLILIPVLVLSQQVTETQKTNRSLTITLAPAFFATLDAKLDHETFWPSSVYVTKNFPLNRRLSFSTGIHFLYKKTVVESFVISDFGPGYSGPTKRTNKMTVFDIPLRLNYHIIQPNDRFNIYAKTELKNSFIANYLKGEPDGDGEYGSNTDYGYNLFFGIGFGLDFRVAEKLSVVVEPGFSYSVIGMIPEVGLIDCQVGVKYLLMK